VTSFKKADKPLIPYKRSKVTWAPKKFHAKNIIIP